MVHNLNCVLDEGKIKYLPEVIMTYDKKLWKCVLGELQEKLDQGEIDAFDHAMYSIDSSDAGKRSLIKDYCTRHKIKPFIPFLVFNISPNWSGHKYSARWMTYLQESIEEFFRISNRFEKIEYNIECGSQGDHLHAHVVAFINPMYEKSVITQHHKGNLASGYRKVFARIFPKGMEGCAKGKFAVQCSVIRKEEYLQDKLDYLEEDKKPLDHKNKIDLGLRKSLNYC